ncbi:response regulator transcription factor [Couchioplanes caeruleus]|uniref:DNA-binding response regulator n=2 Tax=Couchioplanes caeruleus TaxID=56438 RepID=A0A1K0FZP2_9ACTN|nr:response regulator transcription factor [Couchioplanes caeruleus]OJF10538.1 DNA-binding response regulator [Couchioplanes caeruleus subsp. caeruleus]ROP28633.1 DNA-binding response OmpR family regulator [Couchioplanes caeruleus]
MRILVAEDDEHVADALADALRQHGHTVLWKADGGAAVEAAGETDFVLLDLGLPDLDGYEVCRRIRATSTIPIIALTARSEEIDRVMLLQAGADDYVVKPYGFRELLARIEAVMRRTTQAVVPTASPAGDPPLEIGALSIDIRVRKTSVAGRPLSLTAKEFDLLALLAAERGAVLTREHIIEQVWDENWFGSTRTLDVHVGTLRTKLGDKRWIETVRGVGFRLTDPRG